MKQERLTEVCHLIEQWLDYLFPLLNRVPGMSIAIGYQDKPIFAKGWGYACVETKEKMTARHIFRVASHSKTFSAALVFLFVEKGFLRLDEPLVTYLPWLSKNEELSQQSLRQILSHATGTGRDGSDSSFWEGARTFPDKEEFQAYFLTTTSIIEPQTKFKYSNYAYALIGFVLEAVSGLTYDALVTRYIVKPLGLKNTGSDNPPSRKKACHGYTRLIAGERFPITPQVSAGALVSATGFYSTPADLVTAFSAFLLSSFLTPKSRKTMMHEQYPVFDDVKKDQFYCHGVMRMMLGDHLVYGHSGGYPGFITQTLVCPKIGFAVSLCYNSQTNDFDIMRGIFDYLSFLTTRDPSAEFLSFEGRFASFWSTVDIVAGDDKLFLLYPALSSPWNEPIELKQQEDGSFKVTKDVNGYSIFAEKIIFTLSEGKAVLMTSSQSTYYPWKVYLKKKKLFHPFFVDNSNTALKK